MTHLCSPIYSETPSSQSNLPRMHCALSHMHRSSQSPLTEAATCQQHQSMHKTHSTSDHSNTKKPCTPFAVKQIPTNPTMRGDLCSIIITSRSLLFSCILALCLTDPLQLISCAVISTAVKLNSKVHALCKQELRSPILPRKPPGYVHPL